MKRHLGICLLILMLSLCLAACASQKKIADKQRAEAIRDLGEAYMGQGANTRALREFLKAESINPDDPYLQNDLGVAYMLKGNLKLSIKHFKKALKLKPDYSPARNNLGSAYLEQENWAAAIECFTIVKDDLLYGTPHYPMTNLGFVYYKQGDYDQAVYYYKEALDMAPNFPMAYHGIGLVYMAKGEYEDAVEAFEAAIENAPNEVPIYLDLGKAYKKQHEYNKAYETFKKAAAMAEDAKLKEEAEAEAQKVWNR
ncbi:MAG: tetratricopeptide repeat protein [Desulfobacteraceae bacterium]|nr:tetratricopeptide repeat protein [Desulfobacteraceae bacterium]MBC2754079.1 tetratricopeptide repeat protein [Desulfobacteraceae bacterium]